MKGCHEQARTLRRAEAENPQGSRDPAAQTRRDHEGFSEDRLAGQEAALRGSTERGTGVPPITPRPLAQRIALWLGRYLVARRDDVGSVGISHVGATVRASDESVPGTAFPTGPDIPGHVAAQILDMDTQEFGEPLLDRSGLFGFDHAVIEPDSSDISVCPLHIRLDGQDVVLLIPAERLGVLLRPAVALALGRSLIAASEEALG
jgi:hypothetical protein